MLIINKLANSQPVDPVKNPISKPFDGGQETGCTGVFQTGDDEKPDGRKDRHNRAQGLRDGKKPARRNPHKTKENFAPTGREKISHGIFAVVQKDDEGHEDHGQELNSA